MRRQEVCLTFPETHLPNALDLFAFVPYLALNAAGSGLRSAQQALAALVVACCCAFAAAFSVFDMLLPVSFSCFLPVPYLASRAAESAVRSVRQDATAFAWFVAFCCASFETHLPKAFDLFAFVP